MRKMLLRGSRVFFVRKAKNGDRVPVLGRASLPEKVYVTRTTKKMCHVMRREARNEDDHNLVNRRRGARRQRQMQESRKRSSCTLCTQLSFPSLSLSLALVHSLLRVFSLES